METQEPQSVVDLPPGWAELVREQDYSQTLRLGHQLLLKLSVPQIESLVTEFGTAPDEKVKWEASGLLLMLIRNKDPRLRRDLFTTIAAAAKGFVVQNFPRTPFGARSLWVLHYTDSVAAEEFLLSLDPSQFGKEELDNYFAALQYASSEATVKKLQQLEDLGGETGGRAYRGLANQGRLNESQVAEIAERYRTNRTAANLDRIFHVRLRYLIGQPVRTVIDLLGEPHKRGAIGTEVRWLVYQTEAQGAKDDQVTIEFRGETITDVSRRPPERWT
jgi:hypothetical protein